MRWLLFTLIAGCTFKTNASLPDGPGSNAGSDAANTYCIGTFVKICRATPPPANLTIESASVLDTDSDPRCTVVPQTGGPEICALYYDTIAINNQLVARGSRPLALAATNTIVIDTGVVSVASQRGQSPGAGAGPALCDAGTPPVAATTPSAGGGAGGSFGTIGGAGGKGAMDGTGGAPGQIVAPPAMLVGGCDGQDGAAANATVMGGASGAGGGGLYLVAGTSITVGNSVSASGAGGTGGGHSSGGGGGGAGGLIVFEAPAVTVIGHAIANGGGGGEGGSASTSGQSGGDGLVTSNGTAPGGATQGNGAGGNGGPGANVSSAAVSGGNDPVDGGGGGGGGVGTILMIGHAPVAGGDFSPMYVVR